jgi:hypothetical protein
VTLRLLDARQETHGSFAETAAVAQAIKTAIRDRAARLPPVQREALDQITKLARILCGDANHRDHWFDIAGYAELAAASLPPDNSVT